MAITWVVVPVTEFRNLDVDTGTVSTVADNPFRQIQIIVLKCLNEEVEVSLSSLFQTPRLHSQGLRQGEEPLLGVSIRDGIL